MAESGRATLRHIRQPSGAFLLSRLLPMKRASLGVSSRAPVACVSENLHRCLSLNGEAVGCQRVVEIGTVMPADSND